ncbi:4-phosphoerythronate dehydrogenase [Psychrobacter phenylpyruvicus]|uniref:Erythronate-4-phosphate dehydrogenase n=1 Tax=Psychrobacter phenylpyruvicus TaxID=29432 RepID=A0A379LNX8_9GAMM|nr:4-phosphoerythronate dehydrogenase [Psychrobacter phenylpyruvicus]SUD92296.1 Erythronate-4-phosphate dehydrogenase [Psychrobacter phenylpyruvicus]
MLTIIADSNIAHLHDYFNEEVLKHPIKVVEMAGRDITAEALDAHQPDALLIRSVTPVDAKLLDNNHSLQFIGSATIGTDHVNESYLSLRGIRFANAAGCSKHSVAQYVMSAILQLRPEYWPNAAATTTVTAKPVKLGIIGLGNIGGTLARYALDLGWEVLGYDPFQPASVINNASFEQVLTQSNVISLHVPLTMPGHSELPTCHMINAQALAKIPSTTMLINTARGPVISESDLLADLEQNPKRQVVLDVFEHEPVVSAELLNKLAIVTPHIAGYTLEGKLRGTQIIFDTFVRSYGEKGAGILTIKDQDLMAELLPENPYQWQELKQDPKKLTEFYDIKADDKLLREALDETASRVEAQAFDALRKNYALRREWLF